MLSRAELILRLVPRRALPRLDQALLVVVPATALGLCDALGPLNPWSLGALAGCAALLVALVLRRERTRTIPFVQTFLWAAVGFACLGVLLAPLGNPVVSSASLAALLFLLAAFVARGIPLERLRRRPVATLPLSPARERSVAATFDFVFAGLTAAAALILLVALAGALRPQFGFLWTASLDLNFGGRQAALGLGAAKLLILADSLAGGVLLAFGARGFGARPTFAAAAGIAWIAAYARLGPALWHATPTFVVPLFVFVLARRGDGRRPLWAGLVAALAGLLYWPLLVPLGALTLGWWMWRPEGTVRQALVRGFALGALAGVGLALVPGSVIRPPATLVAQPLDGALRLVGGDGVWPWGLLLPSLTSGIFSGLSSLLLGAFGYVGNALWVAAAPGWALLAGLVAAALAFRRSAPRATRAGAAAVLTVVFLALPSHLFSVPLPTPAELTYLVGGSGWLASSAALALVAVAALAGAAVLNLCAQRPGRRLAVALGLGLLLLDADPSAALFPNVVASAAAGALRESRADPANGALFASLYDDDPRARLAQAQVESLFGLAPLQARAFVRTLPATERLEASDLGFPRFAVAVVDLSAYNLYRDAPFTGFIFVPNDLTGTLVAPEQVANPEIDRTRIESVYGNDFAYTYER